MGWGLAATPTTQPTCAHRMWGTRPHRLVPTGPGSLLKRPSQRAAAPAPPRPHRQFKECSSPQHPPGPSPHNALSQLVMLRPHAPPQARAGRSGWWARREALGPTPPAPPGPGGCSIPVPAAWWDRSRGCAGRGASGRVPWARAGKHWLLVSGWPGQPERLGRCRGGGLGAARGPGRVLARVRSVPARQRARALLAQTVLGGQGNACCQGNALQRLGSSGITAGS